MIIYEDYKIYYKNAPAYRTLLKLDNLNLFSRNAKWHCFLFKHLHVKF